MKFVLQRNLVQLCVSVATASAFQLEVSARLRDKALHWFAAAKHLRFTHCRQGPQPLNVQRVPVALFGPASPLECPTAPYKAHSDSNQTAPRPNNSSNQLRSPRRRCGALSQGWDARSGGPPAPAPALLATHSLRPCRSVSSASSTTLHGPTFGRDFSTRLRLVPSSDAAVARSAMVPYPARTQNPGSEGLQLSVDCLSIEGSDQVRRTRDIVAADAGCVDALLLVDPEV